LIKYLLNLNDLVEMIIRTQSSLIWSLALLS